MSLLRPVLRFLSSLHLGIVLIALMAASCIAGSLIAANEKMGVDHGREYVFHTWWFLGLMGLLLVNLCLCSWEKSYIALTLFKKKSFRTQPEFYQKASHSAAVPFSGTLKDVEQLLRKRYTVVAAGENVLYAQKGLFGRCGATIIHIGLLWTMSAGYYRILADDFGWGVYDSTVILPEGQSSESYFTRIDRLKGPTQENLRELKMPFELRALDFKADYHPHSTVARRFASLIEVKDGQKSLIREITMTDPLTYKGYKITQNSFSANERVLRGRYAVLDTVTSASVEIDAGAGDPVKVPFENGDPVYLQVDALEAGSAFHIVDLANAKVLESGIVESEAASAPLAIDTARFQEELAASRYSYLIAALFPNFIFDENQQPTTKDENFDNPAVLVMLFKNGKPNGYTWVFHNAEAQAIIGQPHPEVSLQFREFRKHADTSDAGGLYDYEVLLDVTEKQGNKLLGKFWTKPGVVQELKEVSASLLQQPNVKTPAAAAHGSEAGHSDEQAPTSGSLEGKSLSDSSSGGAGPGPAAGGNPASSRFQVTWLGTTSGNVTFLGFMRDPSVAWLFTGCMIVIFGTLVAFMLVYSEVWVYLDPTSRMLYMATAVRGTSPGTHRRFAKLMHQIASADYVDKDLQADKK